MLHQCAFKPPFDVKQAAFEKIALQNSDFFFSSIWERRGFQGTADFSKMYMHFLRHWFKMMHAHFLHET